MNFEIEDFIGVFQHAVPPEICHLLIEDFDVNYELNLHYKRSDYSNRSSLEVSDDAVNYACPPKGETMVLAQRTQANLLSNCVGRCFRIYSEKFGRFQGIEESHFNSVQVQRTSPGQGYHIWHCEQGNRDSAHRFLFYIAYLNDVEEGGETEFLYYSRRIKPQAGTILLAPAAFTHTHRGNPPLKGNKYIATGWLEW